MPRIELDQVTLRFRVRRQRRVTLKQFLLRGMFRNSVNPMLEVCSLDNVSLRVVAGERLGIIGHNGAGKSTLLKMMAGIYPPSGGQRWVEGRISSLFDLTLGFEMEANGWENIAFRGYLQGETPRSIRAKTQEIAEFSELGDFLNIPVRYYSAGMLVRLAFSIATAVEPEILLIDEVLGAGDMAFQTKACQRMDDLLGRAELIVLVSHDLETIAKLCTRVVWMDHGQIRQIGPPEQIIAAYQAYMCPQPQIAA